MRGLAGSLDPGELSLGQPSDAPWTARAVRQVAALAMAGGALALFAQTITLPHPQLESFVKANWMLDEDRMPIFVAMLVSAVVAAMLSSVYLVATRGAGLLRLEWLTRATRPALPLALTPILLAYDFSYRSALIYLCLLVIFMVMTEWALRDALSAFAAPWRVPSLAWPSALRRHLPLALVAAGALFYAIYFSYYTLLNHHRLDTSAFDLGIEVNRPPRR